MNDHSNHDQGSVLTCGTCQRGWCSICQPTPAGRCPWEHLHVLYREEGGKVCPSCLTDDHLYSCEQVTIMYPIRVGASGDIDYTGGDSDVLYDTAVFADDLFCRGCDRTYTLSDLVANPNA